MFGRWIRRKAGVNALRKDIKSVSKRLDLFSAQVDDFMSAERSSAELLHAHIEKLQPYFGVHAPFYFTEQGVPCFAVQTGRFPNKVFLITQPKAGTYMLSRLLRVLGFVFCEVHMSEHSFSDYRGKSVREAIESYRNFTVSLPLEHQLKLIRCGQFAVGHLGVGEETRALLKGFKLIYAKRELRAALVSNMRFFDNPGRAEGKHASWKNIADPKEKMLAFLSLWGNTVMAMHRAVSGWADHPDILVVPFETITGANGGHEQVSLTLSLAHFVGAPIDEEQAASLISETLGKETITWSGGLSRLDEYWCQGCEEWFLAAGGTELNRRLSYAG